MFNPKEAFKILKPLLKSKGREGTWRITYIGWQISMGYHNKKGSDYVEYPTKDLNYIFKSLPIKSYEESYCLGSWFFDFHTDKRGDIEISIDLNDCAIKEVSMP